MATEIEVTKVLAYMSVYYPAFVFRETTPGNPGTAKAYAEELKEIPYDALQAAAKALIHTNKFFPSLSELEGKALDIILAKKNLPSAFEAWENLLAMGDGEPIKFATGEQDEQGRWIIESTPREWKHPLIETAARRCGWPNFPSDESLSYDRDTFIKAYNDLCKREDDEMRKPELVKQVEQKYIASGIKQLAEGMSK